MVFRTKVAKKNCQTSIEKAYLAFICNYELEFAFEQPLASLSARSKFAFAWIQSLAPAVGTDGRTLGCNCWHGMQLLATVAWKARESSSNNCCPTLNFV